MTIMMIFYIFSFYVYIIFYVHFGLSYMYASASEGFSVVAMDSHLTSMVYLCSCAECLAVMFV